MVSMLHSTGLWVSVSSDGSECIDTTRSLNPFVVKAAGARRLNRNALKAGASGKNSRVDSVLGCQRNEVLRFLVSTQDLLESSIREGCCQKRGWQLLRRREVLVAPRLFPLARSKRRCKHLRRRRHVCGWTLPHCQKSIGLARIQEAGSCQAWTRTAPDPLLRFREDGY